MEKHELESVNFPFSLQLNSNLKIRTLGHHVVGRANPFTLWRARVLCIFPRTGLSTVARGFRKDLSMRDCPHARMEKNAATLHTLSLPGNISTIILFIYFFKRQTILSPRSYPKTICSLDHYLGEDGKGQCGLGS